MSRLDSATLAGWVDGVLAACRTASTAILEIYENDDFSVEMKADDSPLTRADLASHRILVEALERLTPDIPVLSEESAATAFAARRGWPRLWVVDPLDGTREFIKRNGEFTINVALVEDHRPVLGVIAVPALALSYSGIPGHGAFRHAADGPARPIRTRRPPADPPVVLGSRSHGNPRSEAYFEAIGRHERLARGSALKFCAVAEGEADFYPRLGPTSEWDTAAGDAIVQAAGGRVGLPDGRALLYNARATTLNGDFLVSGDPQANWPTPPPAAD
ncbi:3'(2'),5'-bisphosphate nucleotidase CysQ [Wenzhouxiangella sp. XN79A]|uniref:3'(2'),5'-bisphosphate nucleotidase CysQ n=1 Tax=Wenzhouxiangella sp. XN79A TaxID=2724193 RepID=UPI00144AD58D|nr:3'(2'),5'-bisphosphate nucleotidase CysQ [Wenzhouxiangella sp. XN79A]NKI35676.1 3'(2'),5'-bisphosphate nucleotidase CysQ [Wenzhouxiangella sp. XN79A]